MRQVPLDLAIEKNRMESADSWAVLYELRVAGGQFAYFLTQQSVPITFPATDGDVYYPFPIEIGEFEQDGEGSRPSLTIRVSNISREIQDALDQYDGLRNETVIVRVVNTAQLGDAANVFDAEFEIKSTEAGEESVEFQVSAHEDLDQQFPSRKFVRGHCPVVYGGIECGWGNAGIPGLNPPGSTQLLFSCSHLLEGPNGCREHGQAYADAGETPLHPARIWSFPLIPKRSGP